MKKDVMIQAYKPAFSQNIKHSNDFILQVKKPRLSDVFWVEKKVPAIIIARLPNVHPSCIVTRSTVEAALFR